MITTRKTRTLSILLLALAASAVLTKVESTHDWWVLDENKKNGKLPIPGEI